VHALTSVFLIGILSKERELGLCLQIDVAFCQLVLNFGL